MTLKELIYSQLMIKDSTIISIREEEREGLRGLIVRGNWFHDRILELCEREIKSLDYDKEKDTMKLLLYKSA